MTIIMQFNTYFSSRFKNYTLSIEKLDQQNMQHTLSMFVGELEGLDEAKSFIDGSANWKIVDGDLT